MLGIVLSRNRGRNTAEDDKAGDAQPIRIGFVGELLAADGGEQGVGSRTIAEPESGQNRKPWTDIRAERSVAILGRLSSPSLSYPRKSWAYAAPPWKR